MSKRNRNREQKPQTTHTQGELMSEQSNQNVTGSTVSETKTDTLSEASRTKPESTTKVEEPSKVEAEKGGIVKLITTIPSFVWNKAIAPAFRFVKGLALRAWDGIVNTYNQEISAFKELGASQYFLGRGAKLGLMLIKAMIVVAVVYYLNSILFTYSGISLFSPLTLGIILVASLLMVVGNSYLAQKETGEVSARTTGQHIVEAFAAA
jgi:hypothetical protein